MLNASGFSCLVPAEQDGSSKTWKVSGIGTRCFSDLRENAFYMTMCALRKCTAETTNVSRPPCSYHPPAQPLPSDQLASIRGTLKQIQGELRNRAFGEEGELTEALLRIFCEKQGFPNMVSKPELRIIENEEVDAVLVSPRAVTIGFHCNRLCKKEAVAALRRVSRWSELAGKGSHSHSFLLGKDLYVVLSGNLLPSKEVRQLISYCKKNRLLVLLRNGLNLSPHNSLLPPQQIAPIKESGATCK
ncbi:hypothetical protein KP509_03G072900 [Ceratopteris richardii]|nr:hypothetical protein KP509_03G072900 [Ceratopteris richardii]